MEVLHILVVILVSILSAIYLYTKKAYNFWKSSNIPHEKPSFPYGNVKGMGTTIHPSKITDRLYQQFKGTAKFCGIYVFLEPGVVILDLDLVKDVLIRDFNNFNDRGIYYNEKDDPLSAHLFTLEGDKWKTLRAKLTSTFTSGKMRFMFSTVVEIGERLRDRAQNLAKDNDVLNIKELMARFTADVIGACAFGIECNTLNDQNVEFREMGHTAVEKPRYHILLTMLACTFPDAARKIGIKVHRDDVSTFFMNVVQETVAYREQNNIQRADFLDLMIKLKNEKHDDPSKAITLNEIAAQSILFFLASFETTSTTLSCSLYELVMNPDVQEKARQEIQDAIDRHGGQFSYEAMMDMPYIDGVLKETLRRYSPGSVVLRRTQADYKVPGTEHVFRKGMQVLIPASSIHHDPEYFPDPERFDPTRFIGEEARSRDIMTWLPFGEGPRNCVGLRFGMMQARVGLVMLLRNFEFETCAKTPITIEEDPTSFMIMPKDAIHLKVRPINDDNNNQ